MQNWFKDVVAAGIAVAVLSAGVAATQPAYADPVKERQAIMKNNNKAGKALKKAAKAGDSVAAKKQAIMIIVNADKLANLFPKETGRGVLGAKATRAKDQIWTDWDTFKSKLDALKSAAKKVASGNLKAAGDIGKTCGGCHKLFRGKKAKKS
jgi:cytochrome c556